MAEEESINLGQYQRLRFGQISRVMSVVYNYQAFGTKILIALALLAIILPMPLWGFGMSYRQPLYIGGFISTAIGTGLIGFAVLRSTTRNVE